MNGDIIQETLGRLSPAAQKSVQFLSIPTLLYDSLAISILQKAGIANGDAFKVLEEIRSFPIWHERTVGTWCLDQDMRETALARLNGSGKGMRELALDAIKDHEKEFQGLAPTDMKDYYLQTARLSLALDDRVEAGLRDMRSIFDVANHFGQLETERIVDLYVQEGIGKRFDDKETMPEYVLSAFFMRAMYAYKTRASITALRLFQIVWRKRGKSLQSLRDAAIAAHLVGLILSKDRARWKEAEDAYKQSLELDKDNRHGLAQVYTSLGKFEFFEKKDFENAQRSIESALKYEKGESYRKYLKGLLRKIIEEKKG
jgi:tetratricopeptide (TPR) repeat protein